MIDRRMFDFEKFYAWVADRMPDGCRIVECGVANGASSLFLAEQLVLSGKSFRLYMVDSLAYGATEQLNEIIKNVISSGFAEFIEIVPIDSLNASCKYPDDFFDFVFLDSSHLYFETRLEIKAWYCKLKDGGILSGHDYNENAVSRAVNEVIPTYIRREPIIHETGDVDRFEQEQFLYTENTDSGYGVWYCVKDFYKKIN